ncbi:cation channel sperm-associated auxiliary subunit epsilon [Acomys russatus]|uniref:cation channel sperm-associated auxiliary subunit epsilon n=1 Tax=Acomys russatus TaxID=60746 RepID=UPI0021E251C1|nr:cation channel sperm-associated auxiliary subunit epsilon [Acomys russatus]
MRPPEGAVAHMRPPEGAVTHMRPPEGAVAHMRPPEGAVAHMRPPEGAVAHMRPPEGAVAHMRPPEGAVAHMRPPEGAVAHRLRTAASVIELHPTALGAQRQGLDTGNIYHNLSQTLTVWVYDPEYASPEELSRTAKGPSLNSRILSMQLNSLGQEPYVHTLSKRLNYFPSPLTDEGTWNIRLPMTSDDIHKVMKGNKVAFQDCFISDLPFLLTFPIITIPEDPGYLPLSLPAGHTLSVSWRACLPTFAVLVTEDETYQTNDSFRNWNRVRIPPGALSDNERRNLTHLLSFQSGILLLTQGTIYLRTSEEFTKLNSSKGLPDSGIIGIRSRRWCIPYYTYKAGKRRSMVAAWTKNELYLGYSQFRFQKVLNTSTLITALNTTDTVEIETAAYTRHPLEIGVVVHWCSPCVTDKTISIVIYNEDLRKWSFQDFKLTLPMSTVLDLAFLYSAMPDVLLWDSSRIYYCYKNFSDTGIIKTAAGESDLSVLSDGSKIHSVITDYDGTIVIKMENNVMFYFKADITDTVRLHSWTNRTSQTAILFNRAFKPYLLYYDLHTMLQVQEYPLDLEVLSILHNTNDSCPYLAFQHNIVRKYYFIDKGERLTIWTQLVYPENLGLNIIVELYGPNILSWKQSTSYEIASGFCTKTMLTTFYQSTKYDLVDDYYKLQQENMGLLLVDFRPSEFSKTCPLAKKGFEVVLGCDVNKHIRVKGFSKRGCNRRDFSYVIDKEFLRHKPQQNAKIRYDVGKYGCPMRLGFNDEFQPTLQLFNETGFIKVIDANFIIWEIHGRTDYTYNLTMRESGCINEAQTWDSMIEENPGVPLEEVWGPQNYRTCFSYAVGKPGNLNQNYEILNITNRNHIHWPMGHSGMYVFRVKVLDPNYSFCNLSALFAIETFGAIPSPSIYLVAAFLFLLMLTFISVLILSYFWYSKIYRQFIFEPLHKNPAKQKRN